MKTYNSNWCTFLILFMEITAFIPFGINLTVLNAATPAINVFVNVTYKERHNIPASDDHIKLIVTLAQSLLVIGSAVGVIVVRPLLTWFGRRSNLILIHIVSIVSSILMSVVAKFCSSYESLLVGRFLAGVSRGITFTVVPLYVAELVAGRTLGSYQAFAGCLLQVGSALGNAFGLSHVLGGDTTWPYVMALPGLFSVIFLLVIPFIPETPTYLMTNAEKSKSQDDDTADIFEESKAGYLLLKKLRCFSDSDVREEYEQRTKEIQADAKILKANVLQIFSAAKYRRQLFACSLLLLSVQFAGMQAVLQYTNDIFRTAGIEDETATYYAVGLFLLQAAFSLIATPMVHRFGSKRMLMSGLAIINVGLGLLCLATLMKVEGMQYVSLVALVLYFIGAGSGPMVSLLALPTELTTQVSRPTVLWLAGIIFWFFAAFVAFVMPYALSSIGGYTYIIFLVLVSLQIAYVRFFIPNPRNKTVTEIQTKLARKGFGRKKARSDEPFLATST